MKIFRLIVTLMCGLILVSCAPFESSHTIPNGSYESESYAQDVDCASKTDETAPAETTSIFAGTDSVVNTVESSDIFEVTSESVTEQPSTLNPSVGTFEPRALMYHLIRDDVYGPYEKLFVHPADFDEQLAYLDGEGYEYLFAEEWRLTDKPSVIITLDDGYDDNYTEMFPILKSHGVCATIFLVSSLIDTDGYLTSDMIREMASSGLVSFQCHTANHVDLSRQTEDGIREEIVESCAIIENLSGKPVRAIAYPAGAYNDTVISVVEEYFDFAYTTRSPSTVSEYTPLTVPRHYISRSLAMESFKIMVAY